MQHGSETVFILNFLFFLFFLLHNQPLVKTGQGKQTTSYFKVSMKLPGFVQQHSFQLKCFKVCVCQLCVKHSLGRTFNPGTLMLGDFRPSICGFDGVVNCDVSVSGHTFECIVFGAHNHNHCLLRWDLQSAQLIRLISLWYLSFPKKKKNPVKWLKSLTWKVQV